MCSVLKFSDLSPFMAPFYASLILYYTLTDLISCHFIIHVCFININSYDNMTRFILNLKL